MAALIFTAIYFIPAFVAYKRQHRQLGPIMALNFLLGWSLLGWVISLVWALSSDTRKDEKPVITFEKSTAPPTTPATAEKTCPRCAETIKAAARVCRFCGHEFEEQPEAKRFDPSTLKSEH